MIQSHQWLFSRFYFIFLFADLLSTTISDRSKIFRPLHFGRTKKKKRYLLKSCWHFVTVATTRKLWDSNSVTSLCCASSKFIRSYQELHFLNRSPNVRYFKRKKKKINKNKNSITTDVRDRWIMFLFLFSGSADEATRTKCSPHQLETESYRSGLGSSSAGKRVPRCRDWHQLRSPNLYG